MTNKEKYINSFSGVEPSDEIKERILNMASTKKRYSFKALAVALAVLMLIATAMLTANAATDGAIGEKISEVGKEISEKIIVMFNGEEIPVEAKKSVTTDENGNSIVSFAIDLPDIENNETDDEVVFALDGLMNDTGEITIGEANENGEVDTYTYQIQITSDITYTTTE